MRGKIRLFFSWLLFGFSIVGANAFAQPILKILSYNVKHGFEADSAVTAQYISWVKEQNPDIVLYQELNDFSKEMLKNLAKAYGHTHTVIMNREAGVDVTHPLGISSKYPITKSQMFLDSMWHGYLYAQVKGINIFLTHLAPFTLKDRQKDVQRILTHAKQLPAKSDILIAGDFNSLSRADESMYGETLLTSMRKIEGRLEPKSGTPIVKNRIIYRNNLDNGNIDYSVTDRVLKADFFDSYYVLNKQFKNSVPTKANQTKSSKLRRIDYIWVNKNLRDRLVKADIIHDKYTDFMSDHYPVFISIKGN